MTHVCVLGAGIVGLATAYELSQRGFEVTVVDAATTVGTGASGANGAQLSYSYVQPLANASIWTDLPSLLFSSNSPLKLRPKWDAAQWRWCFDFLRACNDTTAQKTTAELLRIAAQSRAGLNALMLNENLTCDYSATGKLVLYTNTQALTVANAQMALQKSLGGAQQSILTPQECIAIEPALANYQTSFAGAVYTPSECAIDAFQLCLALEKILRRRGVNFELGSQITKFSQAGNRITSADTKIQRIKADEFVLSLGVGSAALAKSIGLSLPIYPLKGYSATFDLSKMGASKLEAMPLVNITDSSKKIVFARLGNRLRVAGMVELAGYNQSIDSKAVAKLVAKSREVFPELKHAEVVQTWAGLRPATSSGLPIVGRSPLGPRNLVINSGHGALGLTLAMGSAKTVADLFQA